MSAVVVGGGVTPYTYSILSGSLPTGLTLNAVTGAITGTPSVAGPFSFIIQVTDSTGRAIFSNCQITVSPAPLTVTCPSSSATVSVPYTSTVGATGGVAPYTFAIISGSLPTGLSLNSTTGVITGTPTASGTFNFVLDVTDSNSHTAMLACAITVSPPPLTLTCPTSTATVNIPYSSNVTASGGVPPYTFSITAGSLPSGLTLNSATGAITGTPIAPGSFGFVLQVTDSATTTVTSLCGITVQSPPLTLTCPLNSAVVNLSYNSTVTAAGGVPPYTFAVISGSLPLGLTLNSTTGAITGTPAIVGSSNFTLQVTDSTSNTQTSSCSINVYPQLNVSCPANTAIINSPYSSVVPISGGIPPYRYTVPVGGLPPGLTLNSSTGVITGTPTSTGNFAFVVQVVDSRIEIVSSICAITVSQPLSVSCPANSATLGVMYSSAASASGGFQRYTFSLSSGALPPGLSLNSSIGTITGIPTDVGTYSFGLQVVDSMDNTVNSSCAITVSQSPIGLSCPTNTAPVFTAYNSAADATGGVAPYTFSITAGSLPSGLSLDPASGSITGTPNSVNTYNFTLQVTDAVGTMTTSNCSITVIPAPLSLQCPANTAVVGVFYNSSAIASGGQGPGTYIFSIISGSLPSGFILNQTTGAITGTPVAPGTFPFTLQVMDTSGASAMSNCTLTISTSLLLATATNTLNYKITPCQCQH